MRTLDEIEERLAEEEEDLKKGTVLYECVGDYSRGWISCLKWVLAGDAQSDD